jgi:transposase
MHYVGLDVHARESSLEILNDRGQTLKRQTIRGNWDDLVAAVAKLPRPMSICYEASCGYGTLHEKLSPLAKRVVVAHPGQLRLIFKVKRKNNKFDAGKLSKLLYLDMVPAVHVPKLDVRQWRGLIEFRHKLLARRVSLKNQIKALLRGLNIAMPKSMWTGKGIKWLKELGAEQQLRDTDALRRDLLADELSEVTGKIKRVEIELAKIAAKHPGVQLLMTIPGVGIRTAEAVVAYIDDINRFARATQLGTYFGLVPCQDASASVNRMGHITREGPATVRKMLCEAAWQAIRRSPTIRQWFDRIVGKDPDRRKIAAVAVARKLVVVMGAMLRSGEAWHEHEMPEQREKTALAQASEQSEAGEQSPGSSKARRPARKTAGGALAAKIPPRPVGDEVWPLRLPDAEERGDPPAVFRAGRRANSANRQKVKNRNGGSSEAKP